MNIHNIANQGSVGQARDRATERAGQEKTVIIPTVGDGADQDRATISETGRDTLAAIENLAERARNHGGDRSEIVAAALQRLQSGELSSAAAIEETARRIVESGFVAD